MFGQRKTVFLILTLFWVSTRANSTPLRYRDGILQHKTGLITKLGQIALNTYALHLSKQLPSIYEDNKHIPMDTNSRILVAGILYEFAAGVGPTVRYFSNNCPFTKDIKNGPAMEWLLKKYMDSVRTSQSLTTFLNYRYQFSALISPIKFNTWGFAFKQHLKVLTRKHLSQLLIGSFNANITPLPDSSLQIHLWNKTSKKSLFLGLGLRVPRPRPLGTITQHIFIHIPWKEAQYIASKYK